jgi:cellulose synthase/poly-beta-1,6-N-acetylglucosamine synthase-like glycosyltransferase
VGALAVGPTSIAVVCQLFLPHLIPLADWVAFAMVSPSGFWQQFIQVMLLIGLVTGPIFSACGLGMKFYRLWLATQPSPPSSGYLTHVVVIPAYKEPLDILQMTIGSLASQTYDTHRMIVVLAMEFKDDTRDATFHALQKEFGVHFADMWQTVHRLTEGEIPGKSSNENHAVREIYDRLVPTHDPYSVMVTICDADSLFAPRYIEQLDWTFEQYPNPEYLIYQGILNTYRNFFDANIFIRTFEVARVHLDMSKIWTFKSVQSNYSLTLGFSRDINYWTIDNTPEDLHTTLKAYVHTNGSNVVVPTFAVISNDLVTGWSDRYVQAKRHAWGVTEAMWAVVTYKHMRFRLWASLAGWCVYDQVLQEVTAMWIMLLFPGTWTFIWGISSTAKHLVIALTLYGCVIDWARLAVVEYFMWTRILPDNPAFPRPTPSEWVSLAWMNVVSPVLSPITSVMFGMIPRFDAMLHAFRHVELVYITAPKGKAAQAGSS